MIEYIFKRLGRWIRPWGAKNPFTNVYGLSRTLLAIATACTLGFTPLHVLFTPVAGVLDVPRCNAGFLNVSAFCLVTHPHLEIVRWACVLILAIVASGWRPRLTAIPHAWVAYSFFSSSTIFDGGDQITLVLTILLLPVALLDNRRWHWSTVESDQQARPLIWITAWSAFFMIRVQMAGVYFVSGISKLAQAEWANGTAMYYWMLTFGSAPRWILAVVRQPAIVVALTWGAIALEVVLAIALILPKKSWRPLLVMAIAFHVLIACFFGLSSFATAMIAGLLMYLHPIDEPFRLPAFGWREITGHAQVVSDQTSDVPRHAQV